jgi:hypothetical protein
MAPTGRGWRHERGEAQARGEAGTRRTHRQQTAGCAHALALPRHPRRHTDEITRTPGPRPTTTPTICSSARSSACLAASTSSWCASRSSTTDARLRSGRWSTAATTGPTPPAPTRTIRPQTDMALGVEGDRVRARHTIDQGDQVYCSLGATAAALIMPGSVAVRVSPRSQLTTGEHFTRSSTVIKDPPPRACSAAGWWWPTRRRCKPRARRVGPASDWSETTTSRRAEPTAACCPISGKPQVE